MTDTITDIALTDDEIVAVLATATSQWIVPLRTIDLQSDAEILAAVTRGYRSLAVRELLDGDQNDVKPDVLDLVTAVTEAEAAVVIAAVPQDAGVLEAVPILFVSRRGERGVLGQIDPGGMSRLTVVPGEHVPDIVDSIFRERLGADSTDHQGDAVPDLVFITRGMGRQPIVRVASGGAWRGALEPESHRVDVAVIEQMPEGIWSILVP